jgi:hypothetical protein
MCYINFPRRAPYLSISDSNVDWGQSVKQIKRWIDDHPNEGPIYVGFFGPLTVNLYSEMGQRLTGFSNYADWLPAPDGRKVGVPIPDQGVLLLSPVLLAGQYDPADRFKPLRHTRPREVIGNCILVYDLGNGARK